METSVCSSPSSSTPTSQPSLKTTMSMSKSTPVLQTCMKSSSKTLENMTTDETPTDHFETIATETSSGHQKASSLYLHFKATSLRYLHDVTHWPEAYSAQHQFENETGWLMKLFNIKLILERDGLLLLRLSFEKGGRWLGIFRESLRSFEGGRCCLLCLSFSWGLIGLSGWGIDLCWGVWLRFL